MRSENSEALAILIEQCSTTNAELRSVAHSMGRVEARLEAGQRVHDWLIAHSTANRGEIIRLATELRNVQRQMKAQEKESGDPIAKISAIKELIEAIKDFWPYLASAALVAAKAVTVFAGHLFAF